MKCPLLKINNMSQVTYLLRTYSRLQRILLVILLRVVLVISSTRTTNTLTQLYLVISTMDFRYLGISCKVSSTYSQYPNTLYSQSTSKQTLRVLHTQLQSTDSWVNYSKQKILLDTNLVLEYDSTLLCITGLCKYFNT